ncbi:sensor histidine kinase [[Clostridium] polysaccharolyticum]|uniref:histidine kinase n=1 Tax=[Clostridium] polysaccharolyticum TaxID=29364 RepID=A0A1I0A9D6_9FIRM|nr:sensor histidine kinase [[Clostridium] polysaccharolyticum]SES90320.1 two-component system, sensor histidine kinase YesM [[Clostridium] polysaccharolyticum]
MIKSKIKNGKKKSLKSQMRNLTVAIIVPFVLMISNTFYMVISFNQQYATTLQNATAASEFNFDFKDNLDLDMYYYVVGSKSSDHLPLEEVENARQVINRLKLTTTSKENIWRVKSLLRLCNRLSECMINIEKNKNYDDKMEMLDHDIYVLTGLIQTYMRDYIYYEVKELSLMQKEVTHRVTMTIGYMGILSGLIFAFMLWYSRLVSKQITEPVSQLCKKVEHLGQGDFHVVPIETNNIELNTLEVGFNDMAYHINRLMEREKENQAALHKAELELLQAQINPHFLYNALDSIIWLAESHQDKEVIEMTSCLSTFFRTSLSKGKDIITLAVEKQQVESYLQIQKIRYSDILAYSIQIEDSILQYDIPKLTLQPLVENALYHGVKNKRGVGHIWVQGMEEDGIVLKVIDDGAGMTKEQLEELRAGVYEDRHTGLGLVNVHKRLNLYYGADYGLTFESSPGEGTTVCVKIPKINN